MPGSVYVQGINRERVKSTSKRRACTRREHVWRACLGAAEADIFSSASPRFVEPVFISHGFMGRPWLLVFFHHFECSRAKLLPTNGRDQLGGLVQRIELGNGHCDCSGQQILVETRARIHRRRLAFRRSIHLYKHRAIRILEVIFKRRMCGGKGVLEK